MPRRGASLCETTVCQGTQEALSILPCSILTREKLYAQNIYRERERRREETREE
jgi:hypothetical protein